MGEVDALRCSVWTQAVFLLVCLLIEEILRR